MFSDCLYVLSYHQQSVFNVFCTTFTSYFSFTSSGFCWDLLSKAEWWGYWGTSVFVPLTKMFLICPHGTSFILVIYLCLNSFFLIYICQLFMYFTNLFTMSCFGFSVGEITGVCLNVLSSTSLISALIHSLFQFIWVLFVFLFFSS